MSVTAIRLIARIIKPSWFVGRLINHRQWLASDNQRGDERDNGQCASHERTPVLGRPQLQTISSGTAVKAPMGTKESLGAARDQPNLPALRRKGRRCRVPDPRRCPGNYDGFRHHDLLFAGVDQLRQRTDNTRPC